MTTLSLDWPSRSMVRVTTLLLAAAGCILCGRAASADTFYLVHGGRIEGRLMNPDQSPRSSYVVKTLGGGLLTLTGEQVERVEPKSSIEMLYEATLPTLPDTVAAHLRMAEQCDEQGLTPQREFHLEQIVRLDPDHEEARHALGYSRVDGRWMRQEDWMARQGYVRYRGEWRLPQELEIDKVQEANEKVTVTWRKNIRLWRSWIIKGRDKARQGQTELLQIRDPRAAEALADQLQNKKEPRQLKLWYIEVLGELPTPVATGALIRHALEDADAKVRDACLDQLEQYGADQAVPVFISKLQDDQRGMVHRAAVGLARMKDPRATLPLIDALVTEHIVTVGGPGGLQTGFSPSGGGGLSVGGGPKQEKKEFQNEPVLHALATLHRGVNFGFHQQRWKAWYVSQHSPQHVNLRRSD